MYPQLSLATARVRAWPVAFLLAGALALWFGLIALATPFDHDESQYVAGAALSSHLLIYRDFVQLQPPLHAWLFAPIAALFGNDPVAAMRLATATLGLLTLYALWQAQRAAGIARDSAVIATLLIGATGAFQFTAGVVRNDMLATCFLAGAMMASVRALRGSARDWLAPGILFGLAISTKLSFAPVAAAAGLFVLMAGGRCGMRASLWMAAGGAIGLAPMLIGAMLAPDGFHYGVLTFGLTAPFAWYRLAGMGDELTLVEKLWDVTRFLARGPALVALLLIAVNGYAKRRMVRSPGRRFALWTCVGGLIGFALPTPSHVQYLMPLLPPLALALGYFLEDARRWSAMARQAVLGVLCLAAVPGLAKPAHYVAAMAQDGSPVADVARNARWVGLQVRAAASGDARAMTVATLAPHRVLDSGLAIDPRFAAGPFVYRTGWLLKPAEARTLRAITPETLRDMDAAPPGAILTGYEHGTRHHPIDIDAGLAAYAFSRGYRAMEMPDGIGRLFVRVPSPRRAVVAKRHERTRH